MSEVNLPWAIDIAFLGANAITESEDSFCPHQRS